jgi:hypothetical protein
VHIYKGAGGRDHLELVHLLAQALDRVHR